jgi:outer membrane protein
MKALKVNLVIVAAVLSVVMWSCNQPKGGDATIADDTTVVVDEQSVEEVPGEVVVEETSVTAVPGNGQIVFVNSDTLWNNYQFVKDGTEKLNRTEASMRRQYEAKAKKFQSDYENYMKQGQAGLLTLKQQQDTEARLKQQQQALLDMDKNLSEQLIRRKQELNQQINDTIMSFIKRYRIEKGYTMILTNVIDGDPALDVTQDVVDRLNAKYEFDKKH